ncbi:hypothetical protein NS506_07474 [Nocardia seriolae]|uniref:Uncharacterized protein n=1 Tax=Nocardia seriolae TaxID=37332 RepID=A0ABC8B526_9NOCA|nr:hypothetical protein NS506_07474 [Nocardia seriolae]
MAGSVGWTGPGVSEPQAVLPAIATAVAAQTAARTSLLMVPPVRKTNDRA